MQKKISILVFSLFTGLSMLSAQILAPTKWEHTLSKQDIKQGDVIELIFKIKLDDTWYLYSNVQNYEIDPKKTEFEFEPNDTYKLIGEVKAIGSKTEYDDVFEVDVNYFEHIGEDILFLVGRDPPVGRGTIYIVFIPYREKLLWYY